MHCVVTAGPTCESLDGVRRLTNFSTGRLGSDLADSLSARGHEVTLLRGSSAVHQVTTRAAQFLTFTSTADLREQLRALSAHPVDALFHSAAVSDFRFGKVFTRSASGQLTEVTSGKFSTRDGALLAELVPTPKIIAELRDWFPGALLVGWKYEVDGSQADVLAAGVKQIRSCRTDACVINGPAYGEGFGLLFESAERTHAPNASALFELLSALLEGRGARR